MFFEYLHWGVCHRGLKVATGMSCPSPALGQRSSHNLVNSGNRTRDPCDGFMSCHDCGERSRGYLAISAQQVSPESSSDDGRAAGERAREGRQESPGVPGEVVQLHHPGHVLGPDWLTPAQSLRSCQGQLSHWSSSYNAAFSLVESFRWLKYFLSDYTPATFPKEASKLLPNGTSWFFMA